MRADSSSWDEACGGLEEDEMNGSGHTREKLKHVKNTNENKSINDKQLSKLNIKKGCKN